MTKLSPEVQAAIIKVAGKWALGMASTPVFNLTKKQFEPNEPSEMSGELETNFDSSYKFLMEYLGYSSEE